jgi:hypothetical protein
MIESGACGHVENEMLIDILNHKLIRNLSKSSHLEIGSNIEILG